MARRCLASGTEGQRDIRWGGWLTPTDDPDKAKREIKADEEKYAAPSDPATDFEWVLDGIVGETLGGCPTDTALDYQTSDILNLLAAQTGRKKATDIVSCRTEFARQLDGTHDREDAEQDERDWAEIYAEE